MVVKDKKQCGRYLIGCRWFPCLLIEPFLAYGRLDLYDREASQRVAGIVSTVVILYVQSTWFWRQEKMLTRFSTLISIQIQIAPSHKGR